MSLDLYAEICKLLQGMNDLQAEAYVLSSLAESHSRLGHYPSALSCLRRSLREGRRRYIRKHPANKPHLQTRALPSLEGT
jgi:hypothetical protein